MVVAEGDRPSDRTPDDLAQLSVAHLRLHLPFKVVRVGMADEQVVRRAHPSRRREAARERQGGQIRNPVVPDFFKRKPQMTARPSVARRLDEIAVGVAEDRRQPSPTEPVEDAGRVRSALTQVARDHDGIERTDAVDVGQTVSSARLKPWMSDITAIRIRVLPRSIAAVTASPTIVEVESGWADLPSTENWAVSLRPSKGGRPGLRRLTD
jgi:hypothetical protein